LADNENKAPAYQWYPGDFRRDPRVIALTFESRAVWREALDAMFLDGDRGLISGTEEQLARMCACSVAQLRTFVTENEALNAADMTTCNGIVTLVNRRMRKAYLKREKGRKRIEKYRGKRDCNADVTEGDAGCNADVTPSRARLSSSASAVPPLPPQGEPDVQMHGEPEGEPSGAFVQDPRLSAAARRLIEAHGIDPGMVAEVQDETAIERHRR